jgi:asparagine synthase (glutamine-hydrolysing)
MCGIAGIVNFNKCAVTQQEIDCVTDALIHRGPDGRGVWFDSTQTIALGHRRLSIVDLSENGKQPMLFGNDRYVITYNGEIYNYIEIKEELKSKGHSFRSACDTEVILAAYAQWGTAMLHKFNGMWTFALYDQENKVLLLSRDRFGIKPLYYLHTGERLIFASEVQAIHKLLGPDYPLDTDVLADIAKGSFVNHSSEKSYLKNVKSLPGGYNLHIKDGVAKSEIWYSLPKVNVPVTFGEQAEKFKELLTDSCKLRLRSDVPVGTCLSGGVDSGSITSIINRLTGDGTASEGNYTHLSFCAAFKGSPIDESDAARSLADTIGSQLHVVNVNAPSHDELISAMEMCDGPMHALAFYPIWKLYKYIREKKVIVTLDGQGPDEMLGGYRPLHEALTAAIELKRPLWMYDVYKTYRSQGESSQFSSKKFARRTLLSVLYKTIRNKLHLSQRHCNSSDNLTAVRMPSSQTDAFSKSLFKQFFQAPLPGILNQYDRCSMANSVECRMPFMDYRIVEFVFSLPLEAKVGGGFTKRVLRSAMDGILPDPIRLNKLKIGFNAPIVDWFHGPMREWISDTMHSSKFTDCEYFDGENMRKQFDFFVKKENPQWGDAWKIWPPVHIMWWLSHIQEYKKWN